MTALAERPRTRVPHNTGRRADLGVVGAVAMRGILRPKASPLLLLPVIVMPVFFLVSFSGSFSGLTDIEGYGTDNVLNWMAPYAAVQGGVFGGLTSAFIVANDIETGFFDRLLLAPGGRLPMLFGTMVFAAVRGLIPAVVVLVAGAIGGLGFPGGPVAIVMLALACAITAAFFCCLGLTVAYLLKTVRAMMFVQVIGFGSLFLSIGQVPLSFQTGWLHAVSRVNPMTNIVRTARQGFIGDASWAQTWPGLVAGVLLLAGFAITAMLALRAYER